MPGIARVLRVSGICIALVVVYFILPLDSSKGDFGRQMLFTVLVMGVLLGLLVWQLWFVEQEKGDGRIDGLIVAILGIVVGFSLLFYVIQTQDPTQFVDLHTRLDSLYFTATTVTTTGFGDVHAEGQTARALVLAMMMVNVVLLATAASLLTSKLRQRISSRRSASAGGVQVGESVEVDEAGNG